jgi:hypothetical protein
VDTSFLPDKENQKQERMERENSVKKSKAVLIFDEAQTCLGCLGLNLSAVFGLQNL